MIKKLAASIRQYKKVSALAMLFTVLEVGLDILIPRVMADLIDKGIDQGNMNVVLGYGAVLLLSAVLALTFGALGGRYAARAACGFARNLRQDMYYRVQDFSFSNIDRFSTASIVTRLTTDVTNVQMAYQMIVRLAIRCPVLLVVAMIVSFSIHRELSLIFLGAAPLLFIGLYIIMRRTHPVFERVFRTYDKLNQVVQENLRGIRVVKSFTREDFENKKFDDISQSIYKDFSKAEKTLAFNMPLMQAAMYTCTLLLCWLGARIIVLSGGTELTTGLLMSLFNYSLQILMSLMALSMVLVMITISRASAERIVEVLTEESDLKNGPNPNYYFGIDWSAGVNSDETSITVFNSDRQMVYIEGFNDLDETQTIDRIAQLVSRFKPKKVQVELNSIGRVFYGLLQKKIQSLGLNTSVVGFNTSNESKTRLVNNFQVAIQNQEVTNCAIRSMVCVSSKSLKPSI